VRGTRPLLVFKTLQMQATAPAKPSFSAVSYLQVAPLLLVLLAFFGIPLLMIVGVSFFEFDGISSVPGVSVRQLHRSVQLQNTLTLYLKTVEYALIVWAITLVVGFTVSYFLAFHVRNLLWQMALFLLCTVPFWTSEHHPHDLVDSVPGAQRHLQPGADGHRHHARTARIPAVLRFRGDHRVRAPVHAVHDRADLQFDGAHRSLDRRGGARRRQQRAGASSGRSSYRCRAPASRSAPSS
jgi:hypothetical protein